jgi:HEAT repeat protein
VVLAALASARSDGERLVAVDALTALRPPDAVPPLTALLEQTRSDELRTRIAAALGAIRHGDAQPSLVVLLGDANPGVRYVAVQSLRAIGPTPRRPWPRSRWASRGGCTSGRWPTCWPTPTGCWES